MKDNISDKEFKVAYEGTFTNEDKVVEVSENLNDFIHASTDESVVQRRVNLFGYKRFWRFWNRW